MTLKEILNIISTIVNQDYPQLRLGKDKYNSLLKMANIDYFKLWTGLPEQYQPGQPVTTRGWQVSLQNTEALKPFIEFVHDQVVDANGQIAYPANYVHYSDIMYRYISGSIDNYVPVEPVTHAELADRLRNPITVPSKEYPICTFYDTYIQLYPIDLLNVDLTYLRLPATPEYAETVTNGVNVYDSGSSTQFEWSDKYHPDLIRMILGYLGIPIKDINLLNYVETKKHEGV
jgi:hypothetical protein